MPRGQPREKRKATSHPAKRRSTQRAEWDEEKQKYRCRFVLDGGEQCRKPFVFRKGVERHWREEHEGKERIIHRDLCPWCDLLATRLVDHLPVHGADPEKKQECCKLCERAWFADNENGEESRWMREHRLKYCPAREGRPLGARKWSSQLRMFVQSTSPAQPPNPFSDSLPFSTRAFLAPSTHEQQIPESAPPLPAFHIDIEKHSTDLSEPLSTDFVPPDESAYDYYFGPTSHINIPSFDSSNLHLHQSSPSYQPRSFPLPSEQTNSSYPFRSVLIPNPNLDFPSLLHQSSNSTQSVGLSVAMNPVSAVSQLTSVYEHSPFLPIERNHPYYHSYNPFQHAQQVFTSSYSDQTFPTQSNSTFFDYNNPYPPPSHSLRKVSLTRRQVLRYGQPHTL